MKRILVTGMSGVGKSSVIAEIAARGFRAVDLDDAAYSEWVASADGTGPSPLHPGQEWVWREDRVARLLATEGVDVLFVSGCAPNQGKFRDRFDHIVLLSAPAAVMVHRLTSRDTNTYGQHPEEVARSLEFKETVEPILRSVADVEVDTSVDLQQVVASVLGLAFDGSASTNATPAEGTT